jgi:hypothetical protein
LIYTDPTGHITKDEQKSFENGDMAPMAYSYLMDLTYNYYLAETQKDRDYFQNDANVFRQLNYKSTGGSLSFVDEGIKFMPSKPTEDLTKEEHFFRNNLNVQYDWGDFQILQKNLPDDLKWVELPYVQTLFHQNLALNNRKYVSADGHFEMIFDSDDILQTEDNNYRDMGTYNYYGPNDTANHTTYDVKPYFKWGNIPNTSIWEW